MKESISYTFILNIVIVFIFTCFAVVMGALSYYKAFRANSIIAETIEKYEGFNCVSREEIARKLNNVGYKTPFSVDCNGKGDACIADNDFGYVVTSYNLDMPKEEIIYNDSSFLYYDSIIKNNEYSTMNSSFKCNENGCTTNKHYQYGIYTYMYVELPIVSNLLRLSFFSKTKVMYEFRNYFVEKPGENKLYTDVETAIEGLYSKEKIDDPNLGKVTYVKDAWIGTCVVDENGECRYDISANQELGYTFMEWQSSARVGQAGWQHLFTHITGTVISNSRTLAMAKNLKNEENNQSASDIWVQGIPRHKCGYIRDYSAF